MSPIHPRVYAAGSAYQELELVEGAELRLAYTHDDDAHEDDRDGGFGRNQVWFGSTAWHESDGADFTAHYEIRDLHGIHGCPIVLFSGFALDFQGSVDNRVDFVSAVIEPVGYHAGTLRLRITGGLRDRSFSEPYNWRVYFQIAGGPAVAPARDD